MSANIIDYEVLDEAKVVYANQAEALNEVLNVLINMNTRLQEGWTNQTSEAFINRFEAEYKVNLQNVREAIHGISEYIASYSANRMDEDTASARGIGL